MNIREFYDALYRYAEDGRTYIWSLPRKETYLVNDAAEFERIARQLDGEQSIYFSPGLSKKNFGKYERAKAEDIIGIPALWVDIDILGDGHKAKNLPPDIMAAKSLLPETLPPSIIVFTGGGIHAYWLMRETLDTRTSEEKAYAKKLLLKLQGVIRAKATEKGWTIDATESIEHIFRVPGTFNRKNNSAKRCYVMESKGGRYNPSDFEDMPEPALDPYDELLAGIRRRGGFERRPSDGAAELMSENCAFIRNWRENFATLSEPIWKAVCTNLMRGVGGENIITPLVKKWRGEKYNEDNTTAKLAHYLYDCTPQTCAYIRNTLGFDCGDCDCPDNLKAPCSWSLNIVHQAIAKVRRIKIPTSENTFNQETLKALSILKKQCFNEYSKFKAKCKGNINLNDLEKSVKGFSQDAGQGDVAEVALSEGERLGDAMTQNAIESCPLNLRIPANYSFGLNGVYETKKTDYGVKNIPASGQPIIITRKIFNIDTNTEKVELQFLYRNRWTKIIAKRSEVFSARGIVNLADCGLIVSSESAKPLVKYLQALETANIDLIPIQDAVSKIGWRNNSLKEFILPTLDKKYLIDIGDDGNILQAYRTAGTLEDWTNFARQIRQYPQARFLLAASFAAPLLKIFNERNFMVYLWGTSGGGKTAAIYFAISAWGCSDELVRSFYGTINGIERAAEYSNDFPLAINERQVMTGGNNRQEALETLVYMLEGGRGKVRASKTGLRQMATWRTLSMGTGEEPMSKRSSVQGVKTRILEMNAYPVMPNALCKAIYSFTAKNHGHAGVAYIQKLLEEEKTGYRELYEARRGLLKTLNEDYSKCLEPHLDAISLICTADYFASKCLFGMSAQQAADDAKKLAKDIAAQMPSKADVSDVTRAWDFVAEWIVSNEKRFDGVGPALEPKLNPSYGFYENGVYNIFPTYLEHALENEGFKPHKILKEFADEGLIKSATSKSDGRRFKIRVSLNGTRVYVIQISANLEKFDSRPLPEEEEDEYEEEGWRLSNGVI